MKYKSLIHNGKTFEQDFKINDILSNNNFHWVIDSEIENAELEIKNNTLIWYSGTWYSGTWYYGIWISGEWVSGKWINGIWEDGTFGKAGTFESGIFKSGKMLGDMLV